jgi:hypothetical protein
MHTIILIVAAVVCIVRLLCTPTETAIFKSYKALAHIFVGFLGGMGCCTGDAFFWLVLLVISLVELFCFLESLPSKRK